MKSAIIEAAEFIQREADELFDEYAYVEDDGTHWADRAYEEDHQRLTSLAQRLRAEAASRAAPPAVNESLTTGWVRTTDRLPKMGEGIRVLIYTEGHDFGGEQYFDVLADDMNECAFPYPEQQPEVCRYATHWMPLPAPPAIEGSPSVEKSSVIRAPQRGGG